MTEQTDDQLVADKLLGDEYAIELYGSRGVGREYVLLAKQSVGMSAFPPPQDVTCKFENLPLCRVEEFFLTRFGKMIYSQKCDHQVVARGDYLTVCIGLGTVV